MASKRQAAKKPVATKIAADRHAEALDALAEFEEFRDTILPAIRKDLAAGLDAEHIMQKYQALAAARMVTTLATEQDSSKAMAAAKDVLDRTIGKAKERSEVTHKLQNIPEEQLDSILLSELDNLEDSGDDDTHDTLQ